MQLSRIVRGLAGGFFAEIVNKLVPLLILRFVVQKIGVDGYGVAQFSYWLIDVAVAFVVFGYTNIASVEIGQARDEPARVGRIISEVMALKVVHALIALAALLGLTWSLPSYAEYRTVVTALSFVLLTSAIDLSFVHIGTSRMLSLSVLTISVKILSLVAILLCVRGPEDLMTFALLYFGANGLTALANFLFNVRRYPLAWPDREALTQRFKASLPFAATAFLMLALDRYDIFVVEAFRGTTGSGLYGGPLRIVQALGNVLSSIGMVFFSEVVATKDKASLTRHVSLACWAMFALLLPLLAGSLLTADGVLGLILGSDFRGNGTVLTILFAGLFGQCLITVFGSSVLLFHRRVKALNLTLALGAVLGVPLAYALQLKYGLPGIAYATTSTRLLAGCLMMLSAKTYLDRLPARELLLTAAPAALMYGALVALPDMRLIPTLLVGGIVYAVALSALNSGKMRTLAATLRSRLA
jgi:O-antigen/teichoic acid export membrane protein